MKTSSPMPKVSASPGPSHPTRGTSRWLPALAQTIVFGVLLAASLRAHAAMSREYELKAVLIFNLVQFVDWPASAFDSTNAPLVIGVLGKRDPFGPVLDEAVRGEKVKGHPVVVEHYDSHRELKKCHVLFVCAEERSRFKDIIARLDKQPVLTVADTDGFLGAGGLVRMFTKTDGKIGLKINPESARQANLTVSAKLLRVAQVVREGDE